MTVEHFTAPSDQPKSSKPGMHHVLYVTGGGPLPHWVAYHELQPEAAAQLYSKLRAQGRTVWIETADGQHVPMKGTKRSPAPQYAGFSRAIVR